MSKVRFSKRDETQIQLFVRALQANTGNDLFPIKFWGNYPENPTHTFQDALDKYAEYYQTLNPEQRKVMSVIFWDQIKTLGTPIIEDSLGTGKCEVYFLFPKDKLSNSTEESGVKRDLYLQGDFHGYGSLDGKQRLLELSDTGIMWHKDSMPSESIVVYKYIQVEPSHRGKKPVPELPPFFNDDEGLTPLATNTAKFPEIPHSASRDEYSTHTSPYPGFDWGERIFRVSADSKHAHIPGKPIDWPRLLSAETLSNPRHFVYHATLYSDQAGDLQHSDAPVTSHYHDDLHNSDQTGSPYAKFTRDIQVFKPASGKIDDIIVINDGIPYLITGALDHFEKMVSEGKLSPNTAFVFIHTLPGLKATLSPEAAAVYDKDPSANLPGMGVRLVDYKHGVDQYSDFLANQLFPQLKDEIDIPDDPRHRVMIGSSLSGTASIYIVLNRPDLFGEVIAQSPSPDNRAILSKILKERLAEARIHLSCGEFEHPDYAAANANVEYARELSLRLHRPLHTGAHGHQFMAWNVALESSLPLVISEMHDKHDQSYFNRMSFEEFDQSPNGVRGLAAERKFKESGEIILEYIKAEHDPKLTPGQLALLWFHAGQSYARCSDTMALKCFEEAGRDKAKYLIDILGPAAEVYLQATIAFLKKDINALQLARNKILEVGMKEYPAKSNLVFIPGRVNDMCLHPDLSYNEIFQLTPTMPPLPGNKDWHTVKVATTREAVEIQAEIQDVESYRATLEKAQYEFKLSIADHAVTSGRGANCYFQSFMHTLTNLTELTLDEIQRKYPDSIKAFVDTFNTQLALNPPIDFKKIMEIARELHPLERECIFGPIFRHTYDTMVKQGILPGELLKHGPKDIMLATQTAAFANAFGCEYKVYMSEEQLQLAKKNGMPSDVAECVEKTGFDVNGRKFYHDLPSEQHMNNGKIFELNIVYADWHLNYTLGTRELNHAHTKQIIVEHNKTKDGKFAAGAVEKDSAPLAEGGLKFSMVVSELCNRFGLSSTLKPPLSTLLMVDRFSIDDDSVSKSITESADDISHRPAKLGHVADPPDKKPSASDDLKVDYRRPKR